MQLWIFSGVLILLLSTTSVIGQENNPFAPPTEEELAARRAKLPFPARLEAIRVEGKFIDTPLKEVLADWEKTYHVELRISEEAQHQVPKLADVRMNILTRHASLSEALSVILSGHNLTWHIDKESVIITTRKFARSQLKLHSYDLETLDPQQVVRRLGDRLGPELETIKENQRGYQLLAEENVLRVQQTLERQRQITVIIGSLQLENDARDNRHIYDDNSPFGGDLSTDDPFGERPQ